jgi:hypothetical protein
MTLLVSTGRPTTRNGALAWVAVLAPPLAWAAQLVAGYALQEAGCGRPDTDLWGVGLEPLTASVIIVCGLIAALGCLAGLAAWRAAHGADTLGRVEFTAIAGLAGGLIFLLAIILSGIALFPLDPCASG